MKLIIKLHSADNLVSVVSVMSGDVRWFQAEGLALILGLIGGNPGPVVHPALLWSSSVPDTNFQHEMDQFTDSSPH